MSESPAGAESTRTPIRVLFVMTHAGYSRNFESTLRDLARRGHAVHVAFDRDSHIPSDEGIVERLRAEHPTISAGRTPLRRLSKKDPRVRGAVAFRRGLDYLRYLEPAFRDATKLRGRAAAKAPAFVRPAASRPVLRAPLRLILERLHASIPPHPAIVDYLAEQAPDILLVTPLIEIGSPQLEYVRAARALGIPVVYCVASWDNLTTKGRILALPELVVVWNEAQRGEAVALHGVPPEQVEVTGAGAYDHWFSWRPSTTRAGFCAKVGLPDERPFVLYLGSSEFIAPDEQRHVAEWLRRLRGSPATSDIGVLIRPHPTNPLVSRDGRDALSLLLREDPAAVVWPPQGANPTTVEAREDYFDSLHHAAAAVGVNTSGLIESAIVGCPVFTLTSAEFRETQDGTLHFHHLADAISGTAVSYDQHLRQLTAAVRGETDRERVTAFVERFVRPHGIDEPATPRLSDAVERVAAVASRRPRPTPRGSRVMAPLVELIGRSELRMRSRVKDREAAPVRRKQSGDRLRILFAMHYPGYLRYYDSTLAELAGRGHTVYVCFDSFSKQAEGLEALEAMPEGVHVVENALQPRRDSERQLVRGLRRVSNYVHYLDPSFADAGYLRGRARSRLPRVVSALGRVETLPRPLVRGVRAALTSFERSLPLDPRMLKLLRKARPDVVVVSPLVVGVSPQADLLQGAGAAGIPRALAVASWDHLTTKGAVRVVPERVFVWNEVQRAEAIDLHGIPADRIVVTGAQPFDKWFDRLPSTDRESFCRKVGLDPTRPFVLFVGSTASISAPELEQRFVRDWLRHLRESSDSATANVGVVVRPHPYNRESWADPKVADLGPNAVVWPRHDVNPVSERDRTDYFDSLHHAAAVVGINTSAMIEASIVGRPVLTITLDAFADTQGGTLHFRHLLPENGGFVLVSSSLEEHLQQLRGVLADPGDADADLRRFVERFVRPLGPDRTATRALADGIEAAAALTPQPPRPNRLLVAAWNAVFRRRERTLSSRKPKELARPEIAVEEGVGAPVD